MDTPLKIREPKRLKEYIARNTFNTYIFYDKKKKEAYCTACGKSFELATDGKQNSHINCPHCKELAILKYNHYGTTGMTEYGRILFLTKKGNKTYAQVNKFRVTYADKRPEVETWPFLQYMFSKEKSESWIEDYVYDKGDWRPYWKQRKSTNLPEEAGGGWNLYSYTITYLPSINNVGSDLKYANFNDRTGGRHLIEYINLFMKGPAAELLDKAGFDSLIAERLSGRKGIEINWRATSIRKILKLDYKGIGTLKEHRGHRIVLDDVKMIQFAQKHKLLDHPDTFLALTWMNKDREKEIEKYTDVKKLVLYITKQNQNGQATTIPDWIDYCHELSYLEIELNKDNLFPKDFQKAHEETSKSVRIATSEKTAARFIKSVETIYPEEQYEADGYLIRPAMCQEELERESSALHHCVRTYGDKVIEGRCVILLIRRTEEPDKPFYTLEIDRHREIVQVRGLKNEPADNDVQSFVNKWNDEILRRKTA